MISLDHSFNVWQFITVICTIYQNSLNFPKNLHIRYKIPLAVVFKKFERCDCVHRIRSRWFNCVRTPSRVDRAELELVGWISANWNRLPLTLTIFKKWKISDKLPSEPWPNVTTVRRQPAASLFNYPTEQIDAHQWEIEVNVFRRRRPSRSASENKWNIAIKIITTPINTGNACELGRRGLGESEWDSSDRRIGLEVEYYGIQGGYAFFAVSFSNADTEIGKLVHCDLFCIKSVSLVWDF